MTTDLVRVACITDDCANALNIRPEHRDHFTGRWVCHDHHKQETA